MAITINWGTKVIEVPRTDMLLIQSNPTEIRQLNLNTFRQTLNDLQDDPEGIPFLTTHRHVQPISVGGVTLERVVEIINGYTVTFENGQYAVNLVGANSNVADVTNVNQVSVRSANSAGLTNLDTLLAAAYQGRVFVNSVTGQAGTSIPLGTYSTPVNNFDDAKTIAQQLGVQIIQIQRDEVLEGNTWPGFTFQSQAPLATTLTVDAYADTAEATFFQLTLTGEVDTTALVRECMLYNLNIGTGLLYDCAITGTITLTGGGQVDMINCYSRVAGGGLGTTPVLDFGGMSTDFILRNYHGGLQISNHSDPNSEVSMDISSGRIVFDATNTDGTITVRGIGTVDDDSNNSNFVVNDLTARAINREDLALVEKRVIEAG